MPVPSKTSKPSPAKGQARVPDLHSFIQRVKSARAIVGAHLEGGKLSLDGNVVRIALNDSFAAENVRDAQPLLNEIARELIGDAAKVEVTSDEKAPEPQTATLPLRDDPVVKAFEKHLGGELVQPRKR